MIIVFTISSPHFFTLHNISNILSQGSILIILSMGVIVVKITGGIELSVGGVMTLAGMSMAAALMKFDWPIPLCLIVALLVGTFFGFLNGIFVAKMGIPSFIATLGCQGMAFGIATGMNDGRVFSGFPRQMGYFGGGSILSIPVPVCLSAIAFLSSFILLGYTRFGVYVYAIGGNEESLVLSGKAAWWHKVKAYMYSGFMAGLAGIVVTSRNMTSQPMVGFGMEFEAFAAVVLGGSFIAGRGSAIGAIIGALFIIVLRNGLNVTGVPTYLQLAIIGPALIGSIVLSILVERGLRNRSYAGK